MIAESACYLEQQSAGRRRGVDLLLVQIEINITHTARRVLAPILRSLCRTLVRRGDFGLAITNKALAGNNKRARMVSRITHLSGGFWFPPVPTPLRRRASRLLRGPCVAIPFRRRGHTQTNFWPPARKRALEISRIAPAIE
jgi:hypothetical protein